MMRARLAAVVTAAWVGVVGACSSYNPNAVTEVVGPDYGQFVGSGATIGVSGVLERRCGTLDCHGQVGRPLRLYGQYGLRFIDDAGDVPGVQATTPTEHEANYQSVIGLQPELMTEVVQGNAPPTVLMLLRKPLQLERHKGGPVIVTGDAAYTCIYTWLTGQADPTSCASAL